MPKPPRGGGAPSRSRAAVLTVHDIGPKGDGIAMSHDAPVFIDRALPDDQIESFIARADDNVLRGSIERIISPSPFRVKPPCPYYEQCGGCSLQHANDYFYKGFKQDVVHRALKRAGVKTQFLDTVFCPPRTRRRATFAALMQGRKLILGYYKRRSHFITEIPDCLVVHPDLIAWRDNVAPYLQHILRDTKSCDVFLQMMDGQVEMVITGPLGRNRGDVDLNTREAIVKMVHETGLARVGWRANGYDAPEMIIEQKPLIARFGPLSVSLPLNAFLQPTAEGQQALVSGVMNALPQSLNNAADLFSGCGTFSGPLLERARNVDAVDIAGIEPLKRAAGGFPLNAQNRDLFARPLMREELKKYDAVVFDPPRAGCKEQAAELARSKVPLAVGVSCNPATFARDARLLIDGGLKLEHVQVVDQFVWSHHVEVIAKFVR